MPVYLEDLEEIAAQGCAVPGCDHKNHAGESLYLTPKCHPGKGVFCTYKPGSGVVRVECSKCKRRVFEFVVAERSAADHALIASLLLRGLIRWEPFPGGVQKGELCLNGLRYCTELDEFGVPILHEVLRTAVGKLANAPVDPQRN